MRVQRLASGDVRRSPGASALAVARGVYLTIRVSALGFTLLLPLSGAAFGAGGFTPVQAIPLLAIGCAFHIFAYLLNDVVDLAVDRTEPLRADSLLVRGVISVPVALSIACVALASAFMLALATGMPRAALGWLAIAFAAITCYDLYGKRCAIPLLTDAVQGVAWCALLLFGAAAAGTVPTELLWLALYVLLYVLMVNGVHGGLRDLANDHAVGARTTAIWLGARASSSGDGVEVSASLFMYALVLQAGLCLAAPVAVAQASPWKTLVARWLVVLALGGSVWLLARAAQSRSDRRNLIAAGVAHMVVALAVLPLACLPVLDAPGALLMVAVFVLPAGAMYMYNGSRWCL